MRIGGDLTLGSSTAPVTFTVESLDVSGDAATFVATTSVDRRSLGVAKLPGIIIGHSVAVRVAGTATRT